MTIDSYQLDSSSLTGRLFNDFLGADHAMCPAGLYRGKCFSAAFFCANARRVHQRWGQFISGHTPITPNHYLNWCIYMENDSAVEFNTCLLPAVTCLLITAVAILRLSCMGIVNAVAVKARQGCAAPHWSACTVSPRRG
ncbi:MAG: hypothetical protein RR903_12075, partial [Edwardsiella sp. (in: enterobacteria)]